MSDQMRWRYGDTNPVVAAVDSATVIEIGDMVLQDVDSAHPASTHSHVIEDFQQKDFKERFLGVSMQRSQTGDMTPIRVATTGVFEFDCPSGTFELGDLVGAAREPAGGLFDQSVESVRKPYEAIGRVARREATPTDSVRVDIRSTIMTGGV